jgi:hypothetical protein
MTKYKVHDKVNIPGIGSGYISNIRVDGRGLEIFTILLEDFSTTPDGIYYARECEFSFWARECEFSFWA